MGDDEIVRVRLAKGIGERIVDLDMTKGELKAKSSKQILEEALARQDLCEEDVRELSLMRTVVSSGREPRVHVMDETGERKLIPYDRPGLGSYVHEVGGEPSVSIDYGTRHEIGN